MQRFVILSAVILSLGLVGADTAPNKDPAREAKVGLGGIFTSAIAYFAENNTFVISNIQEFGYAPTDSSRYTFWYSVKGVPTRFPGVFPLTGPCDLSTPPTSVTVFASKTGFVAAAKGNRDDGAACDEWSIDEQRRLVHTLGDTIQ